MYLVEIEKIRQNVRNGFYDVSKHAEEERRKDLLEVEDVKRAIFDGKIIEDYPNDPRGPSCLILGWNRGVPIHVVCGEYPSGRTVIVTVYKPDDNLWDENFEKRRK